MQRKVLEGIREWNNVYSLIFATIYHPKFQRRKNDSI